jgi:hypothetical protein
MSMAACGRPLPTGAPTDCQSRQPASDQVIVMNDDSRAGNNVINDIALPAVQRHRLRHVARQAVD